MIEIKSMSKSETGSWIRRPLAWGFLAAGIGVAAFVPLYHGLTRFYLANSDQDIDLTYQALIFNAGYGVPYHPHTGYGYAILLAPWLTLAHQFGLIDTAGIDALIGSPRFDELYLQIIAAGRALSIVYAIAATAIFGLVAWMCCGNGLIASIAAFLFGTSLGLGYQSSVLRTELPSMLAILVSFSLVLFAARNMGWRGVIALGLSAFAVVFGCLIKVQAVIVSTFLPVVPFLFARYSNSPAPSPRAIGIFSLASAAVGVIGLYRWATALAMGSTWTYQIAALALLVGFVVVYSFLYARSSLWVIPALSAIAAGAGASLVYISDHWWTLFGITNFIEFTAHNRHSSVGEGTASLVSAVVSLGAREMATLWLEFHGGPRNYPLQLLIWLAGAGAFYLMLKWEWRSAIKITFFLAFPLILILIFSVRGYAYYYQIYTELFFILAGSICATELSARWERRRIIVIVAYAMLALFIGGATLRFRLVAPSTGITRDARHACCAMDYATLIAEHFRPYCAQATEACPLNWTALPAMLDTFLKR
jgi:hypothetical protein